MFQRRYGRTLIEFSRLNSPLVSSQLDFWFRTRNRISLKPSDKYNQLFAAMFVELCLKLNRLVLLAANHDAIHVLENDEHPGQKRRLVQAVADAKSRGEFSRFPEILQKLDSAF